MLNSLILNCILYIAYTVLMLEKGFGHAHLMAKKSEFFIKKNINRN